MLWPEKVLGDLDIHEFGCVLRSLLSTAVITTRLGLLNPSTLTLETPGVLKDFQSLQHLELISNGPIRIAQLPSSLRTLDLKVVLSSVRASRGSRPSPGPELA
jgi:hypothetical protein